MNLKKIIVAAVCALALSAGTFAKNHPYGMDIAIGVLGIDATSFKVNEINDGVWNTVKYSYNMIDFFPLKINTYCCPWLDNHLGIYGSIGLLPGIQFNRKASYGGFTATDDDVYGGVALELMVGPAFGVDLGESSVRFQVGAPFHVIGGFTSCEKTTVIGNYSTTSKMTYEYSAFGLGITPQFRFAANKRCSFVVGADFIFDFAMNITQKSERGGWTTSVELNPSDAFRFYWAPYLGLGINFGN